MFISFKTAVKVLIFLLISAEMPDSVKSTTKPSVVPGVPSELVLERKWDTILSELGTNVAIGTVTAGVAAVVLTRGPRMRSAITAFGAGFGAGMTYDTANTKFASK